MKNAVYLYFGGPGDRKLTRGSFEDLQRMSITPTEGMRLTFYDLDADDVNRPDYLCAEGVLHLEEGSTIWRVAIDESTFRAIPRSGFGE